MQRESRIPAAFQTLEKILKPVVVVTMNQDTLFENKAMRHWRERNEFPSIDPTLFHDIRSIDNSFPSGKFFDTVTSAASLTGVWSGMVDFTGPLNRALSLRCTVSYLDIPEIASNCLLLQFDEQEKVPIAGTTTELYRQLLESVMEGIAVVADDRFLYVNPSLAEIFGYTSVDEMRGFTLMELLSPASRPFLPSVIQEKMVAGQMMMSYEIKGLRGDGKEIDLDVNASVIDWEESPALVLSFRDVTSRKQIERQHIEWLREEDILASVDRQLIQLIGTYEIFQAIAQAAINVSHADFSGIMELDEERSTTSWIAKRGAVRVPLTVSDSPREFPLFLEFMREDIHVCSNSSLPESLRIGEVPFLQEEQLSIALIFPIKVKESVDSLLVAGFRRDHILSSRQITLLQAISKKCSIAVANARLLENLRDHEHELEYLSGQRSESQEKERARISRELHDGLGQILTAIKFNLELVEEIKGLTEDDRNRIGEVRYLLDNAMKEVRQISYNLMPSVLEDFGLIPALELLADQFTRSQETEASVMAHGLEGRLDSSTEISLYRIVQEALNNIGKHAKAKDVSIQIIANEKMVRLTIEDDGSGFDPSLLKRKPGQQTGMGLVSMRERARSLGGTFTIDSSSISGTTILVEVPVVLRQEDNG